MVKTILTSIALSTLLWSCSTSQNKHLLTKQTEGKMELKSNKQKVIELLNSIENGNTKPIGYINKNNYKQHNLAVEDGLAGFGKVLNLLPEGSAKVEVIRVFEEGDYVFTHTKYNFFGPKVGFDVFRFENGLIVEHWDNLQKIELETVSGRSQIDGTTDIIDLSKTEENKELVKSFISDVLMGGDPTKITDYISTETYLQHNPNVGDGLKGLGKAIEDLEKAGMPMKFTKNHKILGEGNFVLSISEGDFLKKHVAFYDLFRIENGRIVEHWDTIEEIPVKSEWKNNNGKF